MEMRRDLPEEFWADFDAIEQILRVKLRMLQAGLTAVASEVAHLSDKELAGRLQAMPESVRPFLFKHRKASTPEALAALRHKLLRTIRPDGNVLPGYVPSYALGRALDEAA